MIGKLKPEGNIVIIPESGNGKARVTEGVTFETAKEYEELLIDVYQVLLEVKIFPEQGKLLLDAMKKIEEKVL